MKKKNLSWKQVTILNGILSLKVNRKVIYDTCINYKHSYLINYYKKVFFKLCSLIVDVRNHKAHLHDCSSAHVNFKIGVCNTWILEQSKELCTSEGSRTVKQLWGDCIHSFVNHCLAWCTYNLQLLCIGITCLGVGKLL